jgi:Ca2+-binding RTX toxin-like protein
LDGGADDDTADFSGSATAVNANLATGNATGEGLDTLTAVENLIGSPQGDTLTGDGGDNVITPGAGDDSVDGGAGTDEADFSDATAAVTVDLGANTATGGSGNDSLASIENATGSDFDDTIIDQAGQDNAVFGGNGADTFSQGADDSDDSDTVDGEGGIDMVDYGLRTNAVTVNLGAAAAGPTAGTCNDLVLEFVSGEAGETDCLANLENAILGLGDDTFMGNSFPNRVFPNGGQNVLNGDLALGPFTGGDVLDYSVGYTAGVNVNMAGGATAGDSAVGFENAIGTAFNDRFVGDGQSNTIRGAGGNDSIRSGGGDDTARGGPGNDRLRTGSGDDDAFGGAGNDRINGGGGVDFCKGGPGRDRVRGCEQGKA